MLLTSSNKCNCYIIISLGISSTFIPPKVNQFSRHFRSNRSVVQRVHVQYLFFDSNQYVASTQIQFLSIERIIRTFYLLNFYVEH